MIIYRPGNKFVPSRFDPKAKPKSIRQLAQTNSRFEYIIEDLRSLHYQAGQWNNLSSLDHIQLEEKWTNTVLELLSIGNDDVMRSIHYRLREQMPEECGGF